MRFFKKISLPIVCIIVQSWTWGPTLSLIIGDCKVRATPTQELSTSRMHTIGTHSAQKSLRFSSSLIMSPHATCSFQGHLSSNHKVFQISSCGAEQSVLILLHSLPLETLPCVFFLHCHRYCLSVCPSKSSQCGKSLSPLQGSLQPPRPP